MGETEISKKTTNHDGPSQGGTGTTDSGRGGDGQTAQYIHEGGNHGHHGQGNPLKEQRKAMKRRLTPTLAAAVIVLVAGITLAGGSGNAVGYTLEGPGLYLGGLQSAGNPVATNGVVGYAIGEYTTGETLAGLKDGQGVYLTGAGVPTRGEYGDVGNTPAYRLGGGISGRETPFTGIRVKGNGQYGLGISTGTSTIGGDFADLGITKGVGIGETNFGSTYGRDGGAIGVGELLYNQEA
jgi:hypothetical protein